MKKRMLSLTLAMILVLSLFSFQAVAADAYEWWDLRDAERYYQEAVPGTVTLASDFGGVREFTYTIDGEELTITHYWAWTYDNPCNAKQRLNIYVPSNATYNSAILNMVNNSGWNSNAFPNTLNAGSATTIGNNNPATIALALKRGMIIMSCGAVSRNDAATDGEFLGHSPGTMADTKAAMMFLRANMETGLIPGDPDLAFVTGTSGGGALSVVLAACGNSPDFYPYMYNLGAVGVNYNGKNYTADYSDAYMGTIAYCPILDLPMADQAYEFTYTASRTMRASNGTVNGSMAPYGSNNVMIASSWLANDFVRYVELLDLKDEYGNTITATYDPPAAADPEYDGSANRDLAGTPGGTFITVMKGLLEKGVSKAIDEHATGNATGFSNADAVNTLGSRGAYININGAPAEDGSYPAGSVVEITDLDQFLTSVPTSALKSSAAFNGLGCILATGQNENDLWGSKSERFAFAYEWVWDHPYTGTTANQIPAATLGALNTGKTWDEYISSAAGKNVAMQMKMSSPIPYLAGSDKIPYLIDSGVAFDGVSSDVCDPATYWYVRHGTADRDTSFAVGTILYYLLLDNDAVDNGFIDLNFAWNKGHGGTYDTPEAFAWLDAVVDHYLSQVVAKDVSASVQKLSGNKNDLTIKVVEYLRGGEIKVYIETFSISNNAAGTYKVGPYKVYVDTKGNDQIRACYFVE